MSAARESRPALSARRPYWGGPRPKSLAFSLLLHSFAAFALLWFSEATKTIGEPALYDPITAPHQNHIVWYHLKEIPTISPEKDGETGAEQVARDVIIHDAPDAAHDDRLVWRTPDQVSPVQKTPAPDMIAVARGSDAASKPEHPVEAKAAPVPAKPAPKPFVAPAAPPPATSTQVRMVEPPPSPDPPKLAIPDASLSALTAGGRVRYSRRFVPPPPANRPAPSEVGVGDLPVDAPTLPGSGGASDINALIVNAIHNGALDASPPRQSAISAGPLTTSFDNGGRSSGIPLGAVRVLPGAGETTSVEASLKNLKDPLMGLIESPAIARPYVTTRIAPLEHTLSAPLPPSSRNIPKLIEARFRGRIVYTMLLPMKGLPGYAGDWTIWFAQRQYVEGGGSGAPMRAPLPIRKPFRTDAALTVAPGEVRLSATMNTAGRMDSVAVIEGSGPAADAAIADLESWEFLPALRNLEPVDIDLVVEIPFGIRSKAVSPARVPVLSGVDRSHETPHN